MTIVERVPIAVPPKAENMKDLATKRDKLGHLLPDWSREGAADDDD